MASRRQLNVLVPDHRAGVVRKLEQSAALSHESKSAVVVAAIDTLTELMLRWNRSAAEVSRLVLQDAADPGVETSDATTPSVDPASYVASLNAHIPQAWRSPEAFVALDEPLPDQQFTGAIAGELVLDGDAPD